jgi:predicted DNA-binding transcriptional regulator AlpA
VPSDSLVPLKRVLEACAVSRATFWRVSRSGAAAFPAVVKRGGRLYWRSEDIEAIKEALRSFKGRTAFENGRAAARAEKRRQRLAAIKSAKARSRPPRAAAEASAQGDLFGAS